MSQETKICKHCQSEIPKKANIYLGRGRKRCRMPRWIAIVTLFLLVLGTVSGCGDSSESGESSVAAQNDKAANKAKKEKEAKREYISDEEIDKVYASPDDYEGKYIRIPGKLLSAPEKDGEYIYFQMWHDVKNSSKNTVVRAKNEGADLNSDSYVIIDGKIMGSYDGENMFGGTVSALQVDADSVEISDYITVVSPTIHDCEANSEKDQLGYKITVQRIQFAEDETRVYLNIKNSGSGKFYFSEYSAKALQNGKQYEPQYNYEADYEQIQSELLPGAETSGIIAFPAMEYTDFSLYFDGSSDNYEETIEAYQFDFTITQS